MRQWRFHIRFLILQTLSVFIAKHNIVGSDPNEAIRVVDALSASRYQQFRNDVRAYLLSLPRRYQLLVELPSMPGWGLGEMRFIQAGGVRRGTSATGQTGITGLGHGTGRAGLCQGGRIWLRRGTLRQHRRRRRHYPPKAVLHFFQRLEPYKSASPTLAQAMSDLKIECYIVDVEFPNEREAVDVPPELRRFL